MLAFDRAQRFPLLPAATQRGRVGGRPCSKRPIERCALVWNRFRNRLWNRFRNKLWRSAGAIRKRSECTPPENAGYVEFKMGSNSIQQQLAEDNIAERGATLLEGAFVVTLFGSLPVFANMLLSSAIGFGEASVPSAKDPSALHLKTKAMLTS